MSKKVLELNAECQQCGKRFHVKPSALKHTKFCSKECHDIAQTKGEIISCATCGKELRVSPSLLRERNFCCNECRLKWLSHYVTEVVNVPGHSAGKRGLNRNMARYHVIRTQKTSICNRKLPDRRKERMSIYNRTQNPMNTSAGRTSEMRDAARQREQILKGPCKPTTYPKFHQRLEHRVVAEEKLGRPLHKGEVVHHINGNRHDNRPENLMVFSSSGEHIAYHHAHPEESGVYFPYAKHKGGDAQ